MSSYLLQQINCSVKIPRILFLSASSEYSLWKWSTQSCYNLKLKTMPFSLKPAGGACKKKAMLREINIHVYAKRQMWICTMWPSSSLNFR